jgi:FtsP/CotA-like multicopper oxidase with cupredoxin domain
MRAPFLRKLLITLVVAACAAGASMARAGAHVQCPNDANGDAVPDVPTPGVKCMHLSGGDGFVRMADGRVLYTFGFSDLTGVPLADAISTGIRAANFPAPTIELKEGDKFYLTLTNVGMAMRPDLFDPHSVHFHGFPNQAPIFDGLPETSVAINMGASITYFYNLTDPGTYMYHCHVEAAEHMQQGMLGSLFIHPAQDGTPKVVNGRTYTKFAYNDGDGSTAYGREYPLQLGSFDPVFHDMELGIQPLPFASMTDTYAMLNGRGYPDTVNPGPLPAPAENGGIVSQKVSALITLNRATDGDRILLRITDLNVTRFYTVTALGLPMRVVGAGARIARGPGGRDHAYDTTSVTLGGGESADVIIDASGIPAGTYFLYTTNLNYLSNNDEDFGGMMTEIVIQ